MKNKSTLLVILGLILGIFGGLFFPDFMKDISFLGTIYINILKFMMIPIILTSIIVTIFQSKNLNGKSLMKIVLSFITMFVATFLLTSAVVSILKPGAEFVFPQTEWNGEVTNLSYAEILTNLFPSNIVNMVQNNMIFFSIIFAVLFGTAAIKVNNGERVIEVIKGLKEIFFKMLEYIMVLTPIATFSLVGSIIANYGTSVLQAGVTYILIAYLCSVLTLFFVMILPVWILAKINPIEYIKKVSKVWLMTITTCSSAATLPTTVKTCKEEFNIPDIITDIVVPLGCTIHMCGGAVSFALLGLFCMQMFGISVTPIIFIQMILSATIINMAAPGIPNGGIVIGATYLSLLGIPLDFIGFYSGIYKLLDMSYTTLNVTGDISIATIINNKKFCEK